MDFRSLTFCMFFILMSGCGNNDDNNGNPPPNNPPLKGAPSIAAINDINIREGSTTPISFNVSASDPNQLDLTYQVTTTATLMDAAALTNALNSNTHSFSWDISNEAAGIYDLTFTVTNTNGESSNTTMSVSILAQLDYGALLYHDSCQVCHGNANTNWTGSGGKILCIAQTTFDAAFVAGGKMDGQISPVPPAADLSDIYYYLTNIEICP